jgi:MT-A70
LNLIWHKVRKDGGSDGRGVGFYFRNVTEIVLFGVRGKNARTLAPGRRQVNLLATRKREHSRKPDEQYKIIESCSPGPYLELFARGVRQKWTVWGNQADGTYAPTWKTYGHNSLREPTHGDRGGMSVIASDPGRRSEEPEPALRRISRETVMCTLASTSAGGCWFSITITWPSDP